MQHTLIVYGNKYCPDVFFLRRALDQNGVSYEWRDIGEGDPGFKRELRLVARGNLSVPTVILPDGQVLVEPSPREVLSRLTEST